MELEKLILEEKRAYHKQWRNKNKDKVKAINQRYWQKKVEKKLKEDENNGANREEK